MQRFWDIFFPRICLGCGRVGQYVCANCARTKLQQYHQQICHVCGGEVFGRRLDGRRAALMVHSECKAQTHLDGVVASFVYTDFAEKLLFGAKYKLHYSYLQDIARLMSIKSFESNVANLGKVTYVPLSRRRRWWRGYEHSRLLAEGFCTLQAVGCCRLLKKSRHTKAQVGLSRHQRQQNLQNSFNTVNDVVLPKSVVIIDDVLTTGSTLEQVAKTLKQAGVERVYGFVFAARFYSHPVV